MDLYDKMVNHLLKENTDEPQQLGITRLDDGTYKTVRKSGTYYSKDRNNQIYHRLDGPAIIHASGAKEWYVDNKRHRIGGPAVETARKNVTSWWKDGKLHREDGPAIEYEDGRKEWYLEGNEMLTKQEFDNYYKKKEISKEISSHKNNRIDPGMLEDYL